MRTEKIGNATLHLCDSRHIEGFAVHSVITDPIWPNMPEKMFDLFDDTPETLLHRVLSRIHFKRLAVILRLDSDPRFLVSIPTEMPFFRVMTLPYACPGYIGRKLGGLEMAYLFGDPIASAPGRRVVPGEAPKAQHGGVFKGHPCARNIKHMEYLVNWWSDPGEIVCDPFMGVGTIGVASVKQGRKFVGMEINPEYFYLACKNIEEAQNQQRLDVFNVEVIA